MEISGFAILQCSVLMNCSPTTESPMATMRAMIKEEMKRPTTPPPFLPSLLSESDLELPDKQRISVKVRGNTGGLDPQSVPKENLVIDLSQIGSPGSPNNHLLIDELFQVGCSLFTHRGHI